MTTTMNPVPNGKVRQSLANEIDRLDRMLDGLAEGLNEAVADAVKAAVGTAVREAAQTTLTEVFTNPEVLACLNGFSKAAAATNTQVQPAVVKPGLRERLRNLWQGVRSCVARLGCSCGSGIRNLPTAACNFGRRIMRGLASLWGRRQSVTQFKYQLLMALTVGSAVAA